MIAKSSPGFVVNRVLGPYMMAALQRVERGEAKEKIDEAARTFGMPMGPVELADTVGLDVCASVGNILKMAPAGGSKLDQMVAAGKLGKKSGEGFYVWKDGKPQKAQPDTPWDKGELERLGRELVDPLIRECERVRDERIVESADLVDAGVIFGTGFAPFRGGPLHFVANAAERRTSRCCADRRRNSCEPSGLTPRTHFSRVRSTGSDPHLRSLAWTRPFGASQSSAVCVYRSAAPTRSTPINPTWTCWSAC